jgi:hypothetical protein
MIAWLFIAPGLHGFFWALLQGGIAAGLALLCRQPWSGILKHFLLMPLLLGLLQVNLPSWVYLLCFVLTFLFSRNTLVERVPFYRSSRQVALLLAPQLAPGGQVLDAGSGDGRFALQLAQLRPDLQVTAMENAWGSHLLACLRWYLAGRPANFRPRCQSFWHEDWGLYDAVYVFLSPSPMHKVWCKFKQQGKAGGLLISNTFDIPGVEPDCRLPLSGRLQHALLLWCRHHGTE